MVEQQNQHSPLQSGGFCIQIALKNVTQEVYTDNVYLL